jgi:hypothetical protein
MWIRSGDGRSPGDVGNVLWGDIARRGGLLGLTRLGQLALFVALGQDLDGKVRAVALAQAAADAVRGLDDRVVGQDEAVLGADLDADVAALAPLVDPADVDEVDDRGGAVRSSFGWGERGRGLVSTDCATTDR